MHIEGAAHSRAKLATVDRLGEVGVRAGAKTPLDVRCFASRGRQDDDRRATPSTRTEALKHLHAVHSWHREIQDDEIRFTLGDGTEGFAPARRAANLMAVLADQGLIESARVVVIVDDEDVARR